MSSLFIRISTVFFLTLSAMVAVILWVANKNSQTYFLEYTQRLNAPITMYMAQHGGLVRDNQLSYQAITELAQHVEVINPSLAVYLVDEQGKVLTSNQNLSDVRPSNKIHKVQKVDLNSIHTFIEGKSTFPILGTNPNQPGQQSIFSAFPLYSDPIAGVADARKLGYVYAVLDVDSHQSLFKSIASNYSIQSLFLLIGLTTLVTLFVGLSLFFLITRRLNRLIDSAQQWHKRITLTLSHNSVSQMQNHHEIDYSFGLQRKSPTPGFLVPKIRPIIPKALAGKDEIDTLADTYHLMAEELTKQNANLLAQDEGRRMFYATLSHDLRTPLTTMESYLETLLIKDGKIKAADRKRYIGVAHKQCVKIRNLMISLFEYSKLKTGNVSLQKENFSLLELAYDCVDQFSLDAKQANVDLSIRTGTEQTDGMYVYADIGLVQRVLENLISNAIKNTPDKGYIVLCLNKTVDNKINLEVCNSGLGIPSNVVNKLENEQGPLVKMCKDQNAGSGLGLFIVKSIIELHGSVFNVRSVPGIGAKCSFQLAG